VAAEEPGNLAQALVVAAREGDESTARALLANGAAPDAVRA
jgi:hypothetical protein